jgi:hypothetical protein
MISPDQLSELVPVSVLSRKIAALFCAALKAAAPAVFASGAEQREGFSALEKLTLLRHDHQVVSCQLSVAT